MVLGPVARVATAKRAVAAGMTGMDGTGIAEALAVGAGCSMAAS
jgi:hypothetical protein